MKKTKEKRSWRFTVLDLIIIVVALAVIGAAIYFFGPFGNSREGKEKSVMLEYTIEIKGIESQYLENIRIGETVIDSVTKKEIGKVALIETMPLIEYVLNTESGIMEEKAHPDDHTVLLTISSSATRNEKGYEIDGYRVAIGKLHYLQLPSYVASGYCIGFETVD
ncbi:MAG: DUF4330 domain-containing protein [Clostridia bacterium]|nr:DUF4330 domain-containing protein [Clostridia bacterium]